MDVAKESVKESVEAAWIHTIEERLAKIPDLEARVEQLIEKVDELEAKADQLTLVPGSSLFSDGKRLLWSVGSIKFAGIMPV